jgi:hypothetical protein
LEEKFSFNLSRSPKKYFGSIAHNEQSSKNYFASKQRKTSSDQAATDELEMHAMAIIAKNRYRVDTPASHRR